MLLIWTSDQLICVFRRNYKSSQNYVKFSMKLYQEHVFIFPNVIVGLWRLSASGDITLQGFPVTSGQIIWFVTLEAMQYMCDVHLYVT